MAEAAGLEEIEPRPAPERAELAGADGGGRRAATDGGGQSRPAGHVHPRRQLRAAIGREGRGQVRRCRWGRLEAPCRRQPRDRSADARLIRAARGARDALDPHRVEKADTPGGAARQLDEALLASNRLARQDVPQAHDVRPRTPEDDLRSHGVDLDTPRRVRVAIPTDRLTRYDVPHQAQQYDEQGKPEPERAREAKPRVLQGFGTSCRTARAMASVQPDASRPSR